MTRETGGLAADLMRALAGAAALMLAGCSESTTADPLVPFAQFEAPISLSAHLSSIEPTDGRYANEDNAALVALAVEAGFLSIEPQPDAGPYWRFVVRNAARESDTITFPTAHRVLVGVTDQRTQPEGRLGEIREETLSYNVRFDDRFVVARPDIGPFAIRILAAKPTEHSAWRLREREYLGRDGDLTTEHDVLAEVATDLGRPLLPTLALRIENAKQSAYAAMEQRLLATGQLAYGDAPGTIVFAEAGVMFWARPTLPRALSAETAAAFCADTRVERYQDWRLPTRAEFAAALDGDVLRDTPDRRFWGEIARPPAAGRFVRFVIQGTHGQGALYLLPTGEVTHTDPASADVEGPPPLRPAETRVLCVRSVE